MEIGPVVFGRSISWLRIDLQSDDKDVEDRAYLDCFSDSFRKWCRPSPASSGRGPS